MTEREAILGAKNHVQSAQRYLFDLHKSFWYSTCLRYMKNKMDADDALQEGMISIFSKINQFNPEIASFSTWSSRIVLNQCLANLKKNKILDRHEPIDSALNIQELDLIAYSVIANKEIFHLINKLPVGYRTVFNLYAVEGYEHKEIANMLGITEGTSKSQLFKARNMLKQALKAFSI